MLYVKINPKDTETHWNVSYHEICMSGAPQAPLTHSVSALLIKTCFQRPVTWLTAGSPPTSRYFSRTFPKTTFETKTMGEMWVPSLTPWKFQKSRNLPPKYCTHPNKKYRSRAVKYDIWRIWPTQACTVNTTYVVFDTERVKDVKYLSSDLLFLFLL